EVEAPLTILPQQLLEPPLLIGARQLPPVLLLEPDVAPQMHHLESALQTLPVEGGPQDRMPLHRRPACRLEGRLVAVPVQAEAQRLAIEPRSGSVERMEKDSLLERRQGVQVFDSSLRREQPVQIRLSQPGEREVRRGIRLLTALDAPAAVLDQPP